MGKTISAIECSFISNEFLGDEFCFLNLKNMSIFSYPFIPLHIRHEVKEHFKKFHNDKVKNKIYPKTDAGYFIPPNRLFKIFNYKKLNSFIYVVFGKRNNFKKLSSQESKIAVKITLTAHILKLIFPKLDRMKFVESSDDHRLTKYPQKSIKSIIKRVVSQKDINTIIKSINCYKLTIVSPCDLKMGLNFIKII